MAFLSNDLGVQHRNSTGEAVKSASPRHESFMVDCMSFLRLTLVASLVAFAGLIGCKETEVIGSTSPMAANTSTTTGTGDWNGGGGFAPDDQFNPWYVQNTKEVTYCVEADEQNFGLDIDKARIEIRAAIDYWKTEFAIGQDSSIVGFSVGGQNFTEVPCSNETDIHIQLGLLTHDQLAHFSGRQHYLALTRLTSYDPVNMHGRGFMYFAPASGPLKSDINYLGEKLWKFADAANFRKMATHEFGHVFGMTNSRNSFMRPDVMVYLRNLKDTPEDIAKLKKETRLSWQHQVSLYPYETRQNCYISDEITDPIRDGLRDKIIGIPGIKCLRIEMVDRQMNKTILSYTTDMKTWHPFATYKDNSDGIGYAPSGNLIIPPEQRVVPNYTETLAQYLPMLIEETSLGELTVNDKDHYVATINVSDDRTISITIHPDGDPYVYPIYFDENDRTSLGNSAPGDLD